MRPLNWSSPAWAIYIALFANPATAAYVTELDIYSQLAPCASSAVSYKIASLTLATLCGDSEEKLQSCFCSNTALSKSVVSSISIDINSNCGSSATEDQQSASQVLQKYCNPDSTILFPTPTTNIVEAYITDLAELSYLPSCARDGVSAAVVGIGRSRCPEAASLYAPCVCNKGGLPAAISETMSRSVRSSCSNGEDVTSAQNFFNEYCAMNNGTTSFALPKGPPGDMTYHITALSQYKMLGTCAQTGVASAILDQTASLCGVGPQALASCVCLKSGMRNRISSTLTSKVKYYCDNTATAEVRSALEVLDFYCSAANGAVIAAVTELATESYPRPTSGNGSGSSSPSQTGGGKGGGGGADAGADKGTGDGSNTSGSNKKSGSVNKTAIIAAAVLGVVVIIAIIGVVAFILRRRKAKKLREEQMHATALDNNANGPPELDDTAKILSPSVAGVTELATPTHTPRPELQGGIGVAISELPPYESPRQELHGNIPPGYSGQAPPQELANTGYSHPSPYQLSAQPAYGSSTVSPATPGVYNNGWQSGPVQSYELDSQAGRNYR